MGRNGCGKSTLSKIIAGHPSYNITNGDIKFLGENINSLEPEERSQSGIFLGFQYPIEIPGVSNLEFLRVSTNARRKFLNKEELDTFDFEEFVKEKYENPQAVHHYEITQSSGDTTKTINVGMNITDYGSASAISNYTYEQRLQDEKSQIRLISPRYITQFVDEFRSKIDEGV